MGLLAYVLPKLFVNVSVSTGIRSKILVGSMSISS